MEPAPPSPPLPPARNDSAIGSDDSPARRRRRRKRQSDRAPDGYSACDVATGWLLLVLVVLTPWAFGSTDAWAIYGSSALGWVLGAVWIAKRGIAWREDFQPPRWGDDDRRSTGSIDGGESVSRPDLGIRVIGALQFAVVLSILASLLLAPAPGVVVANDAGGVRFWPGTLDRSSTREALLVVLGLIGTFWATRDWLSYRSSRDRKELERKSDSGLPTESREAIPIPSRVRRLLWVLCVNGALLAVCGFLQRASGTSLLLWMREPAAGSGVETAFGPWPFHQDAAHYFNLLWPVCLAFWLWMQERALRLSNKQLARFDGPQLVLLPCALFMAACPAISSDHGASYVSLGLGAAILGLLFIARRQLSLQVRVASVGSIAVAVLVAAGGGWSLLRDRLTRPDLVLATGIIAESDPFTVFLRVRPPLRPPEVWTPWAELRGEMQGDLHRQCGTVGVTPQGALEVRFTGMSPADSRVLTSPGFLERFGDKEVLVAIVRSRGLRLYSNGSELHGTDTREGNAPSWRTPIGTRYLNVVHRAVTEVALVDVALSGDEVAAATHAPLRTVNERLLGSRPLVFDPVSLTNGLEVLHGASTKLLPDPLNPAIVWVEVRRPSVPGHLSIERSLKGADPGLRGTLMTTFVVKNTPNSPITLQVSIDGGEPGFVEVPARIEREVAVRCRVPHEGTPRLVSLTVADRAGGRGAALLPADARLVLRDLRVAPATTLFAQRLGAEAGLGDLSDRLGDHGRTTLVARRMAATNPFWGTGAGTFAKVFGKFAEPGQGAARFAHDDWLQTRVTLGWTGLVSILLGLVALLFRSRTGRGLPALGVVVVLFWVAMIGCLVSASFSFPLQLQPVLTLFCVIAGLTTTLQPSRVVR